MNFPLVSCLCITKNNVQLLRTAITCFNGQTYPNKELIIVRQNQGTETQEELASLYGLQSDLIKFVEVPASPQLSLGELRNLSIQHSIGEYFCSWDDDDWYHEKRLEFQLMQAVTNNQPSSMLTNLIIFDQPEKKSYFSRSRLWEGTILCRKNVISDQICYPAIPKGEDGHLSKLLMQHSRIYPILSPYLYVYVYHGNNTWSKSHFDSLILKSQQLNSEVTALIEEVLHGQYEYSLASTKIQELIQKQELNYFQFFPTQLLAKV